LTLDDIKEEIIKANKIVILTHEFPDGDAIGSSMAMYLFLKGLGKEVDVVIPEMPKIFNFLPYIDKVKKETNIETMILAKGFSQCIAVISNENCNVIVESDGLEPGEVAQITEIVYEQAGIHPANLKIVEKNLNEA